MASLLSILSVHSHVSFHNYKAANLKFFLAQWFYFQIIEHDIINKYALHMLNLYAIAKNKDYNL